MDLEPLKHPDVFGFGDAAEAAGEIGRPLDRAAATSGRA